MLTVRWRPGHERRSEVIGTQDALRLLDAPATDRGVWWLDVGTRPRTSWRSSPPPRAPRPSTSPQLAAGRSGLSVSRSGMTVLVPFTRNDRHACASTSWP